MREGRLSMVLHVVFFIFVIANLIVLNLWIWKGRPADKTAMVAKEETAQSRVGSNCDKTCQQEIYRAISEATKSASVSTTTTSAKKTTTSVPVASSGVKEFYVPFGSGSGSADDWTDIPGMQVYIDTTKYNKIKQAVFEATIRIPTGNQVAYAQLFNVTEKHPVWFSEVSLEGGTPKLLTSQPITLDKGNNLYQVQVKNSLRFPTFLDQARVHIITE